MQLHRREWYCDICSKPFPQKKSFQEHIKAKHSDLVTKGHIEAVTNRCERAIVTNIICPLCGIELTFQTLEKHLGLHLQEVALFALPRPVPDEGSNGSKAMNLGHPSECSSEYLSRRLSIDFDSDGKQPGGDQPIISLPAIEGIRCICGYQHDDGFLITCDQCDGLQHGVCMDINKGNVPEVYKCSTCIPGAHTLEVEKAINIQEGFVKSTIQAQASVPPQTKATPGHDVKSLEIAQRKLSNSGLPPLDLTALTSQSLEENINAVVRTLTTLQKDEQKKRWSYTWRGKQVITVERVQEILRAVEKYTKIMDSTIQTNLQVTSIVWASIIGIISVRI